MSRVTQRRKKHFREGRLRVGGWWWLYKHTEQQEQEQNRKEKTRILDEGCAEDVDGRTIERKRRLPLTFDTLPHCNDFSRTRKPIHL